MTAPLLSDQDKNVKLISIIKHYPCLYNTNHPDYASQIERAEAWEAIAKMVRDSVANCKVRWKHVRTVYSRHLKKKRYDAFSPRRKYYLEDYLGFVEPFLGADVKKKGIRVDSLQEVELLVPPDTCVEEIICGGEESTPLVSKSDNEYQQYTDSSVDNTEQTESNLVDDNQLSEGPKKQRVCRNQKNSAYELDTKPIFTNSQSFNNPCYESANRRFLLSLEPDMDEMTPQQRRMFKVAVMESIVRILHNP